MEPSSIYGFYSWEKGCGDISADDLIIRQAQIMGSKRIMIIPGFYTDLDNKIKCDTELWQMIEGMQKLVGYATSAGLTSTIEDFDSKTSPIATMSGMSIFLDAVPDLYVTLDTGNFFFHEEDSFEATLLFRNHIRHVHLKDRFLPSYENNVIPEKMAGGEPVETVFGTVMMPCPVGYGHMPIAKIMDVLKQDAYDGVFSIEHFGVSSFSKTILDSINWLKGRQEMA